MCTFGVIESRNPSCRRRCVHKLDIKDGEKRTRINPKYPISRVYINKTFISILTYYIYLKVLKYERECPLSHLRLCCHKSNE